MIHGYQASGKQRYKLALLAAGRATRSARPIPVHNMLERLALAQDQVPAFPDDLVIPFDNNQAKRNPRTLKPLQKVSACFRSDPGARASMCLRSCLAAPREQGQALLEGVMQFGGCAVSRQLADGSRMVHAPVLPYCY